MSNGLGRGLGSLIPQKSINQSPIPQAKEGIGSVSPKEGILKIGVNEIDVNPVQPRKQFTDINLEELVDSIKQYGVIQPLVVTKKGEKYELIAGERRLRASKKAGLTQVPVIVRSADEKEKLELAIIENVQRENLNPVDLGLAYKKLMDKFGLTQEEVAKKVSKSRSSVANTLRILALPEEIQLALIEGRITEGHAKYLVGLDNEVKQMSLFRKILHNKLSVGDTSQEARKMGGTKAARVKINYQDKDKEFALREFFGSKVEVKRKGSGGQVVITFYSDEELKEIVDKVKK